jgi:hypothetical protein
MIYNIMHQCLPLSVWRSTLKEGSTHISLQSLSAGHLHILNILFKWHHTPGWKSLMALYQYPLLECSIYNFDFVEDGALSMCVIKAHRRVIELDWVCHNLTSYLSNSVDKIQRLNVLPREHLKLAFAAISAYSGLFGAGAAFWTPAPANLMDGLCKVLGELDVGSALADDALWLQSNSLAAFTRHYTVATKLDRSFIGGMLGVCIVGCLSSDIQMRLSHLVGWPKVDST